jgi:glucoamylase
LLKLLALAREQDQVAEALNELKSDESVQQVLQKDLQYTVQHWREPSFDLWEEVRGTHFYTRLMQYRALQAGADYYAKTGQSAMVPALNSAAAEIAASLAGFWSEQQGVIMATLDRSGGLTYKISNLDVGVVLAALHGGVAVGPYTPSDGRVLATAHQLSSAFADAFAINRVTSDPSGLRLGPGIGRYPEDRYDGVGVSIGHPWFLATLAMAELNYRLAGQLLRDGSVTLTSQNIAFYRDASPVTIKLAPGAVLKQRDPQFKQLLRDLRGAGDSFLARVRLHAADDGSMSEQFDRDNGLMHGARDLTWNYAAFLTALDARRSLQYLP